VSIKVVLGEDNVLVREGVRALLDSYEDIEVVAVAEDAPGLLAAAADHVPDVVVTDIKMPPSFRLEGIDCAHSIRSRHPDTGVVVLSAHDDDEYALALLGEGHSGLAYLLKERIAQGDELVRAIREVHAGGSVVDPSIAERLSGSSHADQEDKRVLDMMSQGLGYADIAAALGTTQEDVDKRATELFRRMAAGSGVDDLKRLHAAVVERSAQVQTFRSYLPQQVADHLDEGAAEQREMEVTVLFSDIRGFSTIAERLSARQIADVVGRHLGAMADVVAEHGGTIDKFQGDAVMAFFGAPVPSTDHAARAVACALAMQARQRELDAQGWGDAEIDRLQIGIGLNTGVVIAGVLGGGGRLEYTVIGDAVNIAQRLQAEAGGGEVVASATTVAAAGLTAVPIGLRAVKGREEPVEVFRVVG
jgi:class 3 adenylate cyclase/CheY-like chemotaxis protein